MKFLLNTLLIYSVFLTGASVLVAQTVAGNQLDFSIPDSPAATVLNVSASTISRPTTPRAFSTAILNGFDKDGNFQSGINLDVAPYMLAYGQKISLDTYQKSIVVRALARLQTSIATTKGTSDDKSAKLGLGFQAVIFDMGDPRMDHGYQTKLINAVAAAKEVVGKARTAAGKSAEPGPTDDANDIADYQTAVTTAINKLIDPLIAAEKSSRWNRSAWTMAVAPSWNSPTGTSSDLSWNGGAGWSSIGYGFDQVPGLKDSSQIIGGVQYHDREIVSSTVNSATNAQSSTSTTATTYKQNSLTAGLRVLVGSSDTTGSFEFVYVKDRPYGMPRNEYSKFTLEIDKQLSTNLWLTFSAAGEAGRQGGNNKLLVLSSFKWGTSSKN